MKISTILDHIDTGHMALPEFQRGYVWNRDQVRKLVESLYRRHPVGSLLVWATDSKDAEHRGDAPLASGVIKLLLDGQQRMTSLYGLVRGTPPRFFDGNPKAFTGLHFHMEREEFAFYSPIKMKDDPLWIDVSALMQGGNSGLGDHIAKLGADSTLSSHMGDYVGRLNSILGIRDVDLHIDEVTGADKTIEIVVDIFNRVNYAVPVMVHYLDRRKGHLGEVERDRLLFWYLQNAMWGRYSGSTETVIDKDLKLLEELDGGLDRLIEETRLSRGGLRVVPGHFGGATKGARFYPMLYLLSRVGEARDWGTGLPLTRNLLGRRSRLEVHHIFPRRVLKRAGLRKQEINAVANFCFQTKDTNLKIGAREPKDYSPEIEERHPGALASQWIPLDPELWRVENFGAFLGQRRELLARAANDSLSSLLHETLEKEREAAVPEPAVAEVAPEEVPVPGGIESDDEEDALTSLNEWVIEPGLPEGAMSLELTDSETGRPLAILDLAWPEGLQEGFSQPVAVLLNEGRRTLEAANCQGYRYFTTIDHFRHYVEHDVLAEDPEEAGAA